MGSQKKMLIEEHRNEPKPIELFDKEMEQERKAKHELDKRYELAEVYKDFIDTVKVARKKYYILRKEAKKGKEVFDMVRKVAYEKLQKEQSEIKEGIQNANNNHQ